MHFLLPQLEALRLFYSHDSIVYLSGSELVPYKFLL
jgi:hypothetical protein